MVFVFFIVLFLVLVVFWTGVAFLNNTVCEIFYYMLLELKKERKNLKIKTQTMLFHTHHPSWKR